MEELAFRFEPRRALAALWALSQDPDDTSQVFTLVESMAGAGPAYLLNGFRTDPAGQRLLKHRPDILPLLSDREALRKMPEGSLARAYLEFVESEGITADGLVAASEAGRVIERVEGSDVDYIGQRMRDTHDLWHTVTGYSGDLLGEGALLAFNVPQTRNLGIGLVVALGIAKIHQRRAVTLFAQGFLRGKNAAWLPAVEWEELLPLPLGEVRARLGIDGPPEYERLRSDELRREGRLGPRTAAA